MKIILDKIKEYLEGRKSGDEAFLKNKRFSLTYRKLLAEKNFSRREKIVDELEISLGKKSSFYYKPEIVSRMRSYFCHPYHITIEYADKSQEYIIYDGDFDITIEKVLDLAKNKINIKKIKMVADTFFGYAGYSDILEIDMDNCDELV